MNAVAAPRTGVVPEPPPGATGHVTRVGPIGHLD